MKDLKGFKGEIYRFVYGSRKINDPYFYSIFLVLRIVGGNIFHEDWKPNLFLSYHCVYTVFLWNIVLLNFWIKIIGPIGFEFPEDMSYAYIWAGLSGGLMSTFVLLGSRNTLREVYDWVFIEFHAWYSSDLEKLVKYNKKATRLLSWSIFAGVQVVSAALLTVFRPIADGSGLPMFDEPSKIPGVEYTSGFHHAVYAAQVLTALSLSAVLFSMDAIFLVTLTHLSAQLFMLGEELEQAGHSGDEVRVDRALHTFVERHNAIQKCLLRLSDAYKPQSFIIPFMTMVFSTVSFLAFDGSLSSSTSIGMAAAHILHLLNFCLPAQTVLEESETLYSRVMQSNWQTWPVRYQRSLLLIMVRLKRPLGVRCGLSGVFSFQQFASTMQTIYSLYNAARRLA